MSGAKSNVLKNQVVNHLFGGVLSCDRPTQWWLAIYSTEPTGELNSSQPTAITSLVRLLSPDSSPIWTINSNEASNTHTVEFLPVPASEAWSVSHFAIFDNNLNGRPLYHGSFKTVKTIQEGDTLIIQSGKIVIREF